MKTMIVMPVANLRGGAEVLLRELVKHAGSSVEIENVVFLEHGPMVAAFEALGVQTHIIEAGRLRQPARYTRCVRALTSCIRRHRIELVFSWMGKAHLYAGPAASLAGVPAAWYQHGIPTKSCGMDRLQTFIPARRILACSSESARAQDRLWPRRQVSVLSPCVDLEQYDPSQLPSPGEVRRKLGLPIGVPVIGMVGRLQRWKGMHTLVEAMPEVARAFPEVRCVIVGGDHPLEPDYPASLQAFIRETGMEERVMLAGFQRNVNEWMQAMDVVIHASNYEPFGMVVIEAMALGKPVVAGNVGGPSEIITDGVNGVLCSPGDAAGLAHQIVRLLEHPFHAGQMGQRARERAHAFAASDYPARFRASLSM